jgi:type IV pilus assembly protein PilC
MLEPLLIVVLATIVGTMIIALYMPMFSIFNEIG